MQLLNSGTFTTQGFASVGLDSVSATFKTGTLTIIGHSSLTMTGVKFVANISNPIIWGSVSDASTESWTSVAGGTTEAWTSVSNLNLETWTTTVPKN